MLGGANTSAVKRPGNKRLCPLCILDTVGQSSFIAKMDPTVEAHINCLDHGEQGLRQRLIAVNTGLEV